MFEDPFLDKCKADWVELCLGLTVEQLIKTKAENTKLLEARDYQISNLLQQVSILQNSVDLSSLILNTYGSKYELAIKQQNDLLNKLDEKDKEIERLKKELEENKILNEKTFDSMSDCDFEIALKVGQQRMLIEMMNE